MSDFPKIIHQSWKNQNLREDYQKYSQTWKVLHPDYEYRLWTDEDNLELVTKQDPSFVDDYNSYNHYIKRADAARYYYLHEYGGIYADLDFECIRNFDELMIGQRQHEVILGLCDLEFSGLALPNALMISKPRAKFWAHLLEIMKTRVNKKNAPWDTGPELLYEAWRTYPRQNEIAILPPEYFYSINWLDTDENITDKKLRHVFENCDTFENAHFICEQYGNSILPQEAVEFLSTEEKKRIYPLALAITYWSGSWKRTPNKTEKYNNSTIFGNLDEKLSFKNEINSW